MNSLKKLPLWALLWAVCTSAAFAADKLEDGFSQPPLPTRLRAYWWWLNSNVDKGAITKDLEWMQQIGMGGGLIFDAGGPAGPVPAGPLFGTPEWRELFKHALKEGERLGLELTLSAQSGWNLGGPCVKPDEAAKHITWSEARVKGPAKFAALLPEPKSRNGYYRDTFVLAYREKGPARQAPEFTKGAAKQLPTAPLASRAAPIRQLILKASFDEGGGSPADTSFLLNDLPATPGEEDVLAKEILDLSANLDKSGQLIWNAPAGDWRILRFGYTLNGGHVSTSSGGWNGPVVDYLDRSALESYWKQVVEPLIADAGPHIGKTFKGLQTDSWEGGGMNWTANFREEFRTRRGYDPKPYLPVVAGLIVDDRETSNRFLTDLRRTVADCMADNHYKAMAELAAKSGMIIHCEAGGPHLGPFDGLKNLGRCSWPMGEFWVESPHRPTEEKRFFMKIAASAAHIYGKPIACGEGFTSIGPHWNDTLWSSQKPTFDHEACAGLNLTYWHAFTCSPEKMGIPGQEYFAGTHFDPQITWAKQAKAFVAYLNRCQFLLQQGKFVADVCVYTGSHTPNVPGRKQADPGKVLPGYDYDAFNEEVLLTRMSFKDGRIVLPDGMSYRLMALPEGLKTISLPALKKIGELAKAGAVIVGPKPERAHTLLNYPDCDAEVKKIADDLWDNNRAISNKTAKEELASLGVLPDFEADADLDYIHRRDGEAEIYFISNPKGEKTSAHATFRVNGKQPELWDAVTGQRRNAGSFNPTNEKNARTSLPLEFEPYGSLFVVFRHPAAKDLPARASNFPSMTRLGELTGPWAVAFDPKWGGPKSVQFENLTSWTERPEEGIKYYSGTATYTKIFDRPKSLASKPKARVYLDLGTVKEMAEVKLNGQSLGIVWCPPWRVEITAQLKPSGNTLEIDVVNNWPNRLIGDAKLPPEKRLTKTNVTLFSQPPKGGGEHPLPVSGLLGPVTLQETSE